MKKLDKPTAEEIPAIAMERYKKLLTKVRRQFEEIHNLRLEIVRLKEELERYK